MIGIILGGGITRRGNTTKDALSRVKKGLKLFKQGRVDSFVVSGGFMSQKFPKLSEAKLFRNFLVKNGVPKSKIILEEKSRDTLGNAIFCKKLFVSKKLEKNITLVTSDYHLSRSLRVFKHIFGKRYKIIGVKSKPFILHKIQNSFAELESDGLDNLFLSQIAQGKHQKAEKLLYLSHNMYKK